MAIAVDTKTGTLNTGQIINYVNQSEDTLTTIVCNNWGASYATKDTPLGKRFSDEFVRGFQYAPASERGTVTDLTITDVKQIKLRWSTIEKHPDLLTIELPQPLLPGEQVAIILSYIIKLPADRFTGFGYARNGAMHLRDFFIMPAKLVQGQFVTYSNLNLDDAAHAVCDISMTVNMPASQEVITDLVLQDCQETGDIKSCNLSGSAKHNFTLCIAPNDRYKKFVNDRAEVHNSLETNRTGIIPQAVAVDRVVRFVHDLLGDDTTRKIIVSQEEYDRNPFYGLNQLPSFINVFSDDFIYELKFLKTYTHQYVRAVLSVDQRKDSWLFDAIQMYLMMAYIDYVHPQVKVTGGLANVKMLLGYKLFQADFNEQYYYLWLFMARKNLDQALHLPQDELIRFNEQIAGKYYAGLALKYLDNYLENDIVANSIKQFIALNQHKQTGVADFMAIVKGNAKKNVDWFFDEIVFKRSLIDYQFTKVTKNDNTVTATIKNNTGAAVPVPIYLLSKNQVVDKIWINGFKTDSTLTLKTGLYDKLAINYQNELPEFNARNNFYDLHKFKLGNKPFRFSFFKDLEDPKKYQILFVPTLFYNLYDGLSPGLRFYNKTLLDRPFNYDINPMYSTITQTLTGQLSFTINQNFRHTKLYNARFSSTMSYFHYAPDAGYTRLNPTLQLRFRPPDFRSNQKELLLLREIIVHRENSTFVVDDTDDYAVFNARYMYSKAEITGLTSYNTDFQTAAKFGKISGEWQYRRLYPDNRMLSLRAFGGVFLYNKTTDDYFSFALDRATDYLFDYNYYGRSETTGIFSQQLILAEGGFKSKLAVPFANQWISTFNAAFSLWNWVEIYGDIGYIKNRNQAPWLGYDTGIRLNLVPDYFELYLPLYSNNGWETALPNYGERIRFIVTISPNTLISLFTRKWF